MKSDSTGGGQSRLEAHIFRKAFISADGVETQILRDLEFQLQPGTFDCMIGPSGCGKTTTMRILLGLDRDFDGVISLPAGGARVAAVFQEPRLLPWRTVEQNIRLALPKGEAVDLNPLLEVLGLQGLRSRYPAELSLGLERRVALARAFAVMPDILFLDEPFVSLDEHTADRLRKLLLHLWQEHETTVLMITHNVREAVQLADRLLLIDGRPASIVGEVPVTLPRGERAGEKLWRFVDALNREHPEIVRA